MADGVRHRVPAGKVAPEETSLVVVSDPCPENDHSLIFSMAGPNLDIAPIVANNGVDPVLELEAGRTHRVRIINITADDLVEMEIHDSAGLIPWRILAFDGADVPPVHGAEQPARLVTGPGETVDVTIRPRHADLRLIVRSLNDFEATIRVCSAPGNRLAAACGH